MADNEHIETFFTDLRDTHLSGVGVKETSYYPYLSNLLNSIGKKLKPKVRCIIHPRSIGAGLPDGALITADQKTTADDPLANGLIPSRGVIEIKAPHEDVQGVVGSPQVEKYLNKYGLVLVTNLREFVIVTRVEGQVTALEAFCIAPSEKALWKALSNPRKLANSIGRSFNEYLTRVLLQAAPLTAPKEVAWFLASYARDAKARMEAQADLPGLAALRSALEEALGLKFTGKDGEHFFRSSLVQTLFYGVFSAWVLWCKRPTVRKGDKFNWHEAAWSLHVPMIKTLFEQLATPTKLQALGLEEVLNWTQTALNRVDRGAFFANFQEHHAVQYFYEPFLAAYDPVLRKRLGVWFTPPEVVQYMVARIDRVLREQLHVANGFADPNVFVLDPCCGTGAFLVEVLRHIEATLKANGGDALTADDIKTAAMERVFGFELLPAPFVVSHLQLGLLLQSLGAPLSERLHERVGVYLTNALTGWNPEGIRLGTTVGLFAKTGGDEPMTVRYREFWGTQKREALLASLTDKETPPQYEEVNPVAENRFSFRPLETEASYVSWPAVVELAEEEPISGLQEMRRGALMAHDRDTLCERMKAYFDKKVDWTTFAALGTGLSRDAGRFDPVATRSRLQEAESFADARLRRYALYPFDNRWCYYSSVRPLWNEPRPELVGQRADEESFLVLRRFAERPREGRPACFTSALPDYHLLRPNVSAIPLRLRTSPAEEVALNTKQTTIYKHLDGGEGTTANLSASGREYLETLTKANPDNDEELSRAVWHHALAILYAPAYLSEHDAAIRTDWPRIPMPATLTSLEASASVGASVGQLLDIEKPVLGVVTGKLRKELNMLGRVTGPKQGISLAITAGWGHGQKEKDIVMPGRGNEKRRDFSVDESAAIAEGAKELGLTYEDVTALWGVKTHDIYLNNETFWSNVPEAVWEYTIGGYQVLKKWLSYRERQVLGRDISKDEAREFTHMVRRIAALLLLEPELDRNYSSIKADCYDWNGALADVKGGF